jgi:hypothetical protein
LRDEVKRLRATELAVVDKFIIFSSRTDCAPMTNMALESMRIVTGCKTPEQFVAAFHRFCDAKTCFIPTPDTRPVGRALAFSLRLADGTPMLRGTCVVKDVWKSKDNPFKRAGVRLEIQKLSEDSAVLFDFMLAQKTATTPLPEGAVQAILPASTNQHLPRERAVALIPPPRAQTDSEDTKPTVQMQPLELPKPEPVAPCVETRTPGSDIIVPANPLAQVDERALDQFLACSMGAQEEPQDDLAIPIENVAEFSRERMRTILGVAPLKKPEAVPLPIIQRGGTQPLVLAQRPPATHSMFNLHAMTNVERYFVLCALGAALLVAAIVLASAYVFA